MGYWVCKKCGGIYELKPEESPEDFKNYQCECGGRVKYGAGIRLICPGCGFRNEITSKNCVGCGRPMFDGDKPKMHWINVTKKKNQTKRIKKGIPYYF